MPKMPKMPKIPTKILTAMGSYRHNTTSNSNNPLSPRNNTSSNINVNGGSSANGPTDNDDDGNYFPEESSTFRSGRGGSVDPALDLIADNPNFQGANVYNPFMTP